MSKAPQKIQRVYGICWFAREDYDTARAAMADPEALFDTYDEWLAAAHKLERQVAAEGDKSVRIRFDMESFMLYCVTQKLPPYEQTRANWAAQEVKKKYGAA